MHGYCREKLTEQKTFLEAPTVARMKELHQWGRDRKHNDTWRRLDKEGADSQDVDEGEETVGAFPEGSGWEEGVL